MLDELDGLLGSFPPPAIVDSPRADLVEREAVSIVVNENLDCEENTPAPTTYLKMSWKISSGISAKADMMTVAGWKHTPHTHIQICTYTRTHTLGGS